MYNGLMKFRASWFLCLLLFHFLGIGRLFAFQVPKNLSESDRKKMVREFGIPSSSKLLTNPFPLGGYSGIEIAASYTLINIEKINLLGDESPENKDRIALMELNFGKGIYNDVDIFFSFAPFNFDDQIQTYGGLIRWSFYQAKFFPLNLSVSMGGHFIRANDLFVNETFSFQLTSGINVDNLSFYFGAGQAMAEGTFMGGPNGVLGNAIDEINENQTIGQLFIGTHIEMDSLFIAAQMDKYSDVFFSGKIGYRF